MKNLFLVLFVVLLFSCDSSNNSFKEYEREVTERIFEISKVNYYENVNEFKHEILDLYGLNNLELLKIIDLQQEYESWIFKIDSLEKIKPTKDELERFMFLLNESMLASIPYNAHNEKYTLLQLFELTKHTNVVKSFYGNDKFFQLLKMDVLMFYSLCTKFIISSKGSPDCGFNGVERVLVLELKDSLLKLGDEYNARILYCKIDTHELKLPNVQLFKFEKDGKSIIVDYYITKVNGIRQLIIKPKNVGAYNWEGIYSKMLPNGNWDTIPIQGSFIVK